MPLAWNEIRQRAITFAQEWADETRERAEAQTFWNEFFNVFGIRRRTVAAFEVPNRNLRGDTEFIDLFWPGKLIAEHKSAGRDLGKAHSQAIGYIQNLHNEGRVHEAPRYVIVSDFGRIALHDLEPDENNIQRSIEFPLQALPENIQHFAFVAGYETHSLDPEDPANIEAAELLAQLHDTLKAGGYPEHDLERFMVRILFCLFGEDTGLFGDPDVFTLYIKNSTREDGADLGLHLGSFFEVLNTPLNRRQANLDEQLASLPYVNGDLYAERLPAANFNRDMRNKLIACCTFRWTKISPAVFGSLFQSIMDAPARRQIGAHYTSERDIMKLIRSLFLDELREDFQRAKNTSMPAIRRFHDRIGSLKFLDPACGCGNFLVIAFRELRLLELDILRALHPRREVQARLDFDLRSELTVSVDQMHGIEIGEWPARIAEVALWLMDHQMNMEVSKTFGEFVARLPLENSPRIVCGNALQMDWNDVLSANECSYVMGNPPFAGKKEQSAEQKTDMQTIWGLIPGAGVLDYVTCWYRKAVSYIRGNAIPVAFVSTNSVTHGEQPGVMWPALRQEGPVFIHFAHTTFAWTSEARGAAHVHVVIIGFGASDRANKQIFVYDDVHGEPVVTVARTINCYLADAPDVTIRNRMRPICAVPEMHYGSMMIDKDRKAGDDCGLLLNATQRDAILNEIPALAPFVREIYGGDEFLNGTRRWCLWLVDAPPDLLRGSRLVMRRIDGVRRFREGSNRLRTQQLAATPSLFGEIRQPSTPYLLVPKVSSERRRYVPMGFLGPEIIASGSALIVPEATLFHFGVLSSAMHNSWLKGIGGRMKSDPQYSSNLVYNNFPWPREVTDAQRLQVENAAQTVLDARAEFPNSTLADLYDPNAMPRALRQAHDQLDRAVDRCYRRNPFTSERQRLEYLFGHYEELVAPLAAAAPRPRKKRGRRR